MKYVDTKKLEAVRLNMLRARGWRYLRYLHLMHFVKKHQNKISTLCSCGAGLGFAELALAIEFPDIEFYVTDIVAEGRPNYFKCMDLAMRWDIKNIRFGVWDVLQKSSRQFDAVTSTEVLEHIQTPQNALMNMLIASNVATYLLVPYADKRRNADAEIRLNAYLKHGHFVCGFDGDFFQTEMFNYKKIIINGVYWHEFGGAFRNKITALTNDEIDNECLKLCLDAENDLVEADPKMGLCAGMKVIYSH